MREVPCPACQGARLKPVSLAVTLGGKSIAEVAALPIVECAEFLRDLELSPREAQIAERVLKEVNERLRFLLDVGLDYLSLDRPSATLAGGEAQRIRLATQIGSGLVGVLYVLDEPSIGLHQRDNHRLIETLRPAARPRQHADRRRARRGHHPHGRLGRRHRPGRGRARRPDRRVRHRRRPARVAGLADRRTTSSGRREIAAARRPPSAHAGSRARRPGRARAQPARRRRRVPARLLRRRHRRLRLGQVDPGQRHPLQRARPGAQRRAHRARAAHPGHGRRAPRQGRARRPEPDRAHAAVQPGDLHRRLRPRPQAVRRDDRGEGPRLPAGPVLLQRQGRPLRELCAATARSRSR